MLLRGRIGSSDDKGHMRAHELAAAVEPAVSSQVVANGRDEKLGRAGDGGEGERGGVGQRGCCEEEKEEETKWQCA